MVPAQIFEVSVDFEEREFAAEVEVAAAEERDGFVMVRSLCRVLHRLLEVTIPPHLGVFGRCGHTDSQTREQQQPSRQVPPAWSMRPCSASQWWCQRSLAPIPLASALRTPVALWTGGCR